MAIDANIAAKLEAVLAREIPDFSTLNLVERLTGGANQETYRIEILTAEAEQTLALRRAAGGKAVQTSSENIGLHNEARLINIAERHDIPVPKIIYQLKESDELGGGFLMDWLKGETRGARIVRHERYANLRKNLARDCGRLLAKIHAIDLEEHAIASFLPERSPEEFVRDTWANYCALDTPQPMLDYTAIWLLNNLPLRARRALVHNDFRNGNLMVDDQKIIGVLDWEVAHVGDPYRDLGWMCTGSWRFGGTFPVGGFGSRDDFFAGYTAESGTEIYAEDVKFWEIFGSFWWGVGCLLMADQYRNGPDPSVERPAIGRRSSECQIDCVNLLIPGPVESTDKAVRFEGNFPSALELINSAVNFLRDDVMNETSGRTNFYARVAANSLEIAAREHALRPAFDAAERTRLQGILGHESDLISLRWTLVEKLRSGSIPLNDASLCAHLRQTVYDNITIDQPTYAGYHAFRPAHLPRVT
ncbi:MAG: phosphotransferase family protein [Pseudomonadota bacterium]